jgi:NAD(P)-dependent dehydrogenase (short-subunit alcohol dehydrogenase family)
MTSSPPVCAVVGVGPGLGLALARRFARENFKIAALARRQAAVDEVAASLGGGAVGVAVDAADPAAVTAALARVKQQLGPPSVLIYNAAALTAGAPSTLAPERVLADFTVNVVSALAAVQAVLPDMRAAGRGTVLLTGGGFALEPQPGYASLGLGKAALRNLSQSLFKELTPQGIHAATVTVCGYIKPGTAFDPDAIADTYWTLHTQPAGAWAWEHVFR